jgi:hypothetical protein
MADKQTLQTFITERLGTPSQAEPAGVAAERARQDALKAKRERLNGWRAWNQKEHAGLDGKDVSGEAFKALREACGLSVGDVAEITGTSPNDVATHEAGIASFASTAYKRLGGSMDAALDEQA